MSVSLWVKLLWTGFETWVWEGKASGPAEAPIRLDERIPREHPEVGLLYLRPKSVLGQRVDLQRSTLDSGVPG